MSKTIRIAVSFDILVKYDIDDDIVDLEGLVFKTNRLKRLKMRPGKVVDVVYDLLKIPHFQKTKTSLCSFGTKVPKLNVSKGFCYLNFSHVLTLLLSSYKK